MRAEIIERDAWRCVRCGTFLPAGDRALHHRVLGDRSDNRPSNLIALCTECHVHVHAHSRDARACGWIVSRHSALGTAQTPVLYGQPSRTGLYLLDDDLGVNTAAA